MNRVVRGCRDPDVVRRRDAEKEDRETESNSLMHTCVCVQSRRVLTVFDPRRNIWSGQHLRKITGIMEDEYFLGCR